MLPPWSSRNWYDVAEIGAIGCAGVKDRVRSLAIIEVEIAPERGARLDDAVVVSQTDLLVFDQPPHPLNENVVALSVFSIRVDGDAVGRQQAGEG